MIVYDAYVDGRWEPPADRRAYAEVGKGSRKNSPLGMSRSVASCRPIPSRKAGVTAVGNRGNTPAVAGRERVRG